MSYCCVTGCNKISSARNRNDNIAFHALPTETKLKAKWLKAIGRANWNPPKNACVCSKHFSPKQTNRVGKTIQLKNDAIPTLELPVTMQSSLKPSSVGKAPQLRLLSLGIAFSAASKLEVCRFCLVTDVKLLSLLENPHKLYLESLVGYTENELPQYVCFECAAHLKRCYDFIEKSMVAQTALLDIFTKRGKVTMDCVERINRKANNLTSSLTKTVLDTNFEIECNGRTDDADVTVIEKTSTPSSRKLALLESKVNAPSSNEDVQISFEDTDNEMESDEELNEVNLEEETLDEEFLYSTDEMDDINEEIHDLEDDVADDAESPNEDVEVPNERRNDTIDEGVPDDWWDMEKVKAKKMRNKRIEEEEDGVEFVNNFDIYELSLDEQIEEWKRTHVKCEGLRYQCQICFAVLENETLFQSHLRIHSLSKGKWRCRVCQYRFKKRHLAYAHIILKHLKRYRCKQCLKVYDCVGKAKQHMRKSKCDSLYKCTFCEFETALANELAVHRRIHKDNGRRTACVACGITFNSKVKLMQHTALFHGVSEGGPHVCSNCGDSFRTAQGLNLHTTTMHLDLLARSHLCSTCGEAFNTLSGLKRHTTVMHPGARSEINQKEQEQSESTPTTDEAGDFPCEQCNITFNSAGARRVHMLISKQHKRHTDAPNSAGGASKKSACNECGIEFELPRLLVEHVKRLHMAGATAHSGDKPDGIYPRQCEYCDMEMKSRAKHLWHLRRRHRGLPSPFRPTVVTAICATCGKGFPNKWLLARHELRHRAPTIPCPKCSRLFHDAFALAAHASVHLPERPFRCSRCPLAFRQKSNLVTHIRTHTGVTPFECPICEKQFKYSGNCNIHVRTVHFKEPYPRKNRHKNTKKIEDST